MELVWITDEFTKKSKQVEFVLNENAKERYRSILDNSRFFNAILVVRYFGNVFQL